MRWSCHCLKKQTYGINLEFSDIEPNEERRPTSNHIFFVETQMNVGGNKYFETIGRVRSTHFRTSFRQLKLIVCEFRFLHREFHAMVQWFRFWISTVSEKLYANSLLRFFTYMCAAAWHWQIEMSRRTRRQRPLVSMDEMHFKWNNKFCSFIHHPISDD